VTVWTTTAGRYAPFLHNLSKPDESNTSQIGVGRQDFLIRQSTIFCPAEHTASLLIQLPLWPAPLIYRSALFLVNWLLAQIRSD